MRTAIVHGLIVPKPKPKGKSNRTLRPSWQKGKRLIFRYLQVDIMWQHNRSNQRRHVSLEEFSFLFN